MLPVADLDRSIAFYTRLLGMKLREPHSSEARKVEVGLIGYGCTILENEGVAFIKPFRNGRTVWVSARGIRDPDGHELELAERHSRP